MGMVVKLLETEEKRKYLGTNYHGRYIGREFLMLIYFIFIAPSHIFLLYYNLEIKAQKG